MLGGFQRLVFNGGFLRNIYKCFIMDYNVGVKINEGVFYIMLQNDF